MERRTAIESLCSAVDRRPVRRLQARHRSPTSGRADRDRSRSRARCHPTTDHQTEKCHLSRAGWLGRRARPPATTFNNRRRNCDHQGINDRTVHTSFRQHGSRYVMSVWLAQMVEALVAPTHVRLCVQEVRVRSPERTSSTLAFIPPG